MNQPSEIIRTCSRIQRLFCYQAFVDRVMNAQRRGVGGVIRGWECAALMEYLTLGDRLLALLGDPRYTALGREVSTAREQVLTGIYYWRSVRENAFNVLANGDVEISGVATDALAKLRQKIVALADAVQNALEYQGDLLVKREGE